MSRDELRALLLAARGEGVHACLAALDDPATTVDVEVTTDHLATTAQLARIYRRRAEHARRIGLLTVGLDEAVAALETAEHDQLRLSLLNAYSGYPWCVVFLTPDCSEVVAATAVLGRPPPAEAD